MNALVVQQYHWLLTALAVGMLVALASGVALARREVPDGPAEAAPEDAARRQVLPHVMLLLVALAVATGILVLLPAAMILRYIAGYRVLALLLAAVAIITAPLLYAWRARSF